MSEIFTQERYEALVDAYLSGTLTVSYGGQTIQYRSLAEIERLIAFLEVKLGIRKADLGPLHRYHVGYYKKGV